MRAFRLPRLRKRLWAAATGAAVLQGSAIIGVGLGGPVTVAVAAAVALLTLLLAFLYDLKVTRPLAATSRGAEIIAKTNPGHKLELNQGHWLERLPETIENLGANVARTRHEMEEAATSWNVQIEARRARLETILREIREGVLVCDDNARIVLYNRAARQLLEDEPALGLGRNINEVLDEGPLRHTLNLLSTDAELVCATRSGARLVRCRLAKLQTDDPDTSGFVMTLQDVSEETREALRREQALRRSVEAFRNPLTSLAAATQSLTLAQQENIKDAAQRFTAIINEESTRLADHFSQLSKETGAMMTDTWRLEDVHLGSLIDGIRERQKTGLPRIQASADVWISAEPYLISQVIEALLKRLHEELGVAALALMGREEGSMVYMDLTWSGDVAAAEQLDEWLNDGLEDVGGTVTLREILDRHGTTAWSQPDVSRFGRALLRLPLPGAPKKATVAPVIPARPEYYDFAIEEQTKQLDPRAEETLDNLDYIVFDCETTGLEPSRGDEIVSIGAVRIHGGQVMHGETFELLANPGRDIPALATSIHGIRNEDIIDAPPVEEAVRRFHAFAGNAVLVGFNIAFDMRFLKLKQRISGVVFDHTTLDALLLSILLHDHTGEHTMESVAQRLGVGVGGRHTALGDSLTTAEIFVRLLELLPANGIHTLDNAVAAQEKMIEFRRQQRAF